MRSLNHCFSIQYLDCIRAGNFPSLYSYSTVVLHTPLMVGSAVLYQTLRSLSSKPGTKTKQQNKREQKKQTNKQTKNKTLQDETQKRA